MSSHPVDLGLQMPDGAAHVLYLFLMIDDGCACVFMCQCSNILFDAFFHACIVLCQTRIDLRCYGRIRAINMFAFGHCVKLDLVSAVLVFAHLVCLQSSILAACQQWPCAHFKERVPRATVRILTATLHAVGLTIRERVCAWALDSCVVECHAFGPLE